MTAPMDRLTVDIHAESPLWGTAALPSDRRHAMSRRSGLN